MKKMDKQQAALTCRPDLLIFIPHSVLIQTFFNKISMNNNSEDAIIQKGKIVWVISNQHDLQIYSLLSLQD